MCGHLLRLSKIKLNIFYVFQNISPFHPFLLVETKNTQINK